MNYGKFIDAEGELNFQLRFLAKALGDDDSRPFFKYIYIEPSDKGEGLLGVASDGRYLHIIDPLHTKAVEDYGITPGFWQIFKNSSAGRTWAARLDDSEAGRFRFPDWRKVMPAGNPVYKTTFAGFSPTNKGKGTNYPGLVTFLREFPEATAINLEYLQALGTSFNWNVEWYGPNKALKFIEGNRVTLIMPMQME